MIHPVTARMSLRRYLLQLLSAFLLLTLLLVSLGYYALSERTVNQIVQMQAAQVADKTQMKLERYFAGSVNIAKILQETINTGLVSLDDKDALQKMFVSAIRHVPFVTFISGVDHAQGEYIGATRTPDTQATQLMTALVAEDRQLSLYQVTEQNLRGELIRHVRTMDARTRPWYQQGQLLRKLGWYPVYKYLPYKGLGIGVVAPIFHQHTGEFDGVIAVDMAVDHISSYLKSLDLGANGVAYLIDDMGKLVATSLSYPVYTGEMAQAEQLLLRDYPDARLQALADHVQPQGTFELTIDGRDYHLHKRLMRDDHGLYFVLAVLLAEDDYAPNMQTQWLITLVLVGALFLAGLWLLSYLLRQLLVSIDQLKSQTLLLAEGQWQSGQVVHGRFVELNALADAFNDMARRLRESFALLEQRVVLRTAELAKANLKLEGLSNTDGLTGIANRRAFDDHYTQLKAIAYRNNQPLSLLMMDVDWFKLYNDHYGHLAGDDALKAIAVSLQHAIKRHSDIVARYGGEEFVVVLCDTDQQAAGVIAESILAAIVGLQLPHARSPLGVVSLSIGIATWHPGEDDLEQLLSLADKALYQAKALGRNRYAVFQLRDKEVT